MQRKPKKFNETKPKRSGASGEYRLFFQLSFPLALTLTHIKPAISTGKSQKYKIEKRFQRMEIVFISYGHTNPYNWIEKIGKGAAELFFRFISPEFFRWHAFFFYPPNQNGLNLMKPILFGVV